MLIGWAYNFWEEGFATSFIIGSILMQVMRFRELLFETWGILLTLRFLYVFEESLLTKDAY